MCLIVICDMKNKKEEIAIYRGVLKRLTEKVYWIKSSGSKTNMPGEAGGRIRLLWVEKRGQEKEVQGRKVEWEQGKYLIIQDLDFAQSEMRIKVGFDLEKYMIYLTV